MTQPAPNLILVLADEMRADCLGAAGHPCVETPNLDALASRGVRFTRAYSAVPSCIPARAALWTGMNQWHTGILGMGVGDIAMPSDYPHTLAGVLSAAGYRTHMVGKGHFNPMRASMGFQTAEHEELGGALVLQEGDDYRTWFEAHRPNSVVTPDDHGVSTVCGARPWHTEEWLHPSAWTMTRALKFLEARDKTQPCFLNISINRPHFPMVPPADYFHDYFDRATPPAVIGEWTTRSGPEKTVPFPWPEPQSARVIHRGRSGYYGEISFLDAQVGRLVNHLNGEAMSSPRPTWVIFTSDHGDMLGDHGLWGKMNAYEGSIRIPLIIAPVGLGAAASRKQADEVVELRDIMPTVLDLAGVAAPPTVDGQSLRPLLSEPATEWREFLHGEHSGCFTPEFFSHFVTNGDRKLLWYPRIGLWQFFDLSEDSCELRNLYGRPERREEIERWRGRLARELAGRDCGWVQGGRLVESPPREALVSPYQKTRYQGPGKA